MLSRLVSLYNRLLLDSAQRDRLTVVLVSPRNPLNMGAAARAMANFGFSHLAVVAPYEPHWREAKSAVGAESLLQNARCTQTLGEAIADCTFVLGTGTLTHRKPEQPVVPLPLLAPFLQNKGRTALVFGPEKRGLTRDDLAICHALVEIPTDSRQPSMNLGQAVAVCLYELTAPRETSQTPGTPGSRSLAFGDAGSLGAPGPSHLGTRDSSGASAAMPATSRDLDLLAETVNQTMAAANYSPSAMRNANRHDLQLILRRLALTHSDARRILGLFRKILWRIQHRDGPHKT
jgi:TrmH family RNA methyltransferase